MIIIEVVTNRKTCQRMGLKPNTIIISEVFAIVNAGAKKRSRIIGNAQYHTKECKQGCTEQRTIDTIDFKPNYSEKHWPSYTVSAEYMRCRVH